MISHSPPIFSHSPPVSFLADYMSGHQRPALNRGPKKHVIFADDEGLSLTEVRVMSEPSNVPPYWSMKFLEQITQGLVSPHPPDQWTVDFKQPASDYLSFRQKIDRDFVSLENVIVKDEESIVVGTIKVKNVDFQKEIIVRVTWDDWKSQQDIFCTFARAYGPSTCAHVVFDTFSFKITLPPSSKRLEFCICYRINDTEYWDNNDGTNYTISKRSPFYYNALSPYDKGQNRNSSQQIRSTLTDALAKVQEQNGWHQEPHTPYW
ncbi:protein phosphatase 1 regulatory subunit 3C isoform X2 [Drosophila obscura]|uniref:protein phosphatase 1 regulatory subunit 3C isoform X2 n=1 Tax=Drosophila obscura TaxID=7282 RepID=UPI000BA037EC|nr:protein phosphatase 1 regulatory subunit 3C isoform X2 [Drosophila obscura]